MIFFAYFTTSTHSSQLKFPVSEVWREEEVRKNIRTPKTVLRGHPALPDSFGADFSRNSDCLSLSYHFVLPSILCKAFTLSFVLQAACVGSHHASVNCSRKGTDTERKARQLGIQEKAENHMGRIREVYQQIVKLGT